MLAPADQQRAYAALSRLATADLAKLWAKLNLGKPAKLADPLAEILAALTGKYGSAAATLAADWYDEARAEANVSGKFRAAPVDVPPSDRVEALSRWGVGPMFGANPDGALALSLLSGGLQRMVANMGRDTTASAVALDPAPVQYARHASANACEFCRMLASRGPIYGKGSAVTVTGESLGGKDYRKMRWLGVSSDVILQGARASTVAVGGRRSRASLKRSIGEKYHDDCHCVAVPVFPGQEYKPAPYVDQWEAEYAAAREAAGSGDTKAILAEMRQQQKASVSVAAKADLSPAAAVSKAPRLFSGASDANTWAANRMLDVKTLPGDVQEQIRLYTGGAYRGTNQALRTGVFSGANGKVQREMVSALDTAIKQSTVPEDVIVSRVVNTDAFKLAKGKTLSDLTGTVFSDKGFLSTALGKAPTGPGFGGKNVSMEITVPKGTHAIWTRPLSQFKNERELLLARSERLAIDSVEQNTRTGKWLIKASVVPSKK